MQDKSISISIILPVRNGEQFLQLAINSILAQTYYSFEFIIIDNLSSDSSPSIIKENACKDSRIRVLNCDSIGIANVLNLGLKECRGNYVARIDCDDEWHPKKLEIQVNVLRQNPSLVLLGTSVILIDDKGIPCENQLSFNKGRLFKWEMIKGNLSKNNLFCHSSVIFRKREVMLIGGYSNKYKHSEDYYLWYNIVKRYPSEILPDKLVKYRVHNDSISNKNYINQQISSLKVKSKFIFSYGNMATNLYQVIYSILRLLKMLLFNHKG